ncbi:MAG: glycosyltransferase [Pseudomonadota bacterium]
MKSADGPIRVAYFINQYPAISHSFIRREIQALERAGATVYRFAIRPAPEGALSAEDAAEQEKTSHIVNAGVASLAGSIAQAGLRNPLGALAALFQAIRLGWRSEAGLFRHILYFGEALALADWMRAENLAHVHAHFGTNSAMIAMLAARLDGFSFSVTIHGPEEFEKPDLIALPEKATRAAFSVAISQYGAAQLKKLTETAVWPRINIVHCGVEKSYRGDAPPAAQNTLLCVGRLCPEKGQIDLVRAVAKARAQTPDLCLRLIGDGPMRAEIESAARESGVGDLVRFEGWRAPAEVREALNSCRVFVLPSYAEGLPVSIMEALAMRRPVISTYIAGIPELVTPDCGWLTPAGDVDAIAAAINEAMNLEPAALARMGEAGQARVAARHDIDIEAAKLAELFRLQMAPVR